MLSLVFDVNKIFNKMNKAVFLDRDGVINNPRSNYYVSKIADFEFNTHIFPVIRGYQEQGYLIIVISNQGGISKKLYTIKDVEKLHAFMTDTFKKENIIITETYFCPHHNSIENCICRKPDSLLLEKAVARFNINKTESYFIGDSVRDVEAAKKAGIKGILISKNGELPKKLS